MSQRTPHYPSIGDYGMIGNCHTAALISSRGSIDWLCLPRFDSASIFAAILDQQSGGAWTLEPTGPSRARHAYLPDTNVLETTFTSDQGRLRVLDFMPVRSAEEALRPNGSGLLVRLLEAIDGEIEFESRCSPRPDYARRKPELVANGQRLNFNGGMIHGPAEWQVDSANGVASCRATIRDGERLAFVLTQGVDRFDALGDPGTALDATVAYWHDWIGACSYQGDYRDAVVRSALALKLLTFAPTGAIVAAPTTSLPEEIGGERNWDYRFTWIRDASFTLYALLLAGFVEEDEGFFRWIAKTVELEETGIKVLYPITPDGSTTERILDHLEGYRQSRPVRIGNAAAHQLQLDIYGEVFDALHFAWRTGDFDPASVWHRFRPLVDWVARNWHLPGSGIWEVRGGKRNFVYAKAMSWVALDRAITIARALDLPGDIDLWTRSRDAIRTEVFAKGWSERLQAFKQSYEDERLDAANLRLSIVGFIDGSDPRMVSTIDATLDRLVEDGLCYRYLDAPEGLSGREGAFVLCTFWLIDALILAGRANEAEQMYKRMLRRRGELGLLAEEIDPSTGEQLGNYPQAFSHIGVISAAVSLAHVGQHGHVEPERARAAERAGSGGGGQQRRRSEAIDQDRRRSEPT